MTLLFDQNISFRLCKKIKKMYPDAYHVFNVMLKDAPDSQIWQYAKQNSCCIVTYDSDFENLITLYGSPPKVIWLRTGNKSTSDLIEIFQVNQKSIQDFLSNPTLDMLVID